jgi:hypothetical protein
MDHSWEDSTLGRSSPAKHLRLRIPNSANRQVFCDSPRHAKHLAGKPWDPSTTDAEVLADVEAKCDEAPEFMPMADYRAKKAIEFG